MKLGIEQLDDLALGSVFLATGGGGDPYIPKLIARQVLQELGPVSVVAPDQLPDDALVVAIGAVGAPTVSLEMLPSVDEAANTLAAFERHTGRTVDAVASFEIGGGNSLVPIVAAAGKNIPVVDGDGMARALPEAQMMTYAMAGIRPTPAVAYDYAGNITTYHTDDAMEYERLVRTTAMTSGGMITTAEHPMTGAQLKDSIIPGTLSFSIALGQILREHRGPAEVIQVPLQRAFNDSIYGACRLIFSGKVVEKSSRVVGGYDVGEAVLLPFDSSDHPMQITIKNEYLLAAKDGKVCASVPDLIVIVDSETSMPINAERLRYGQRVAVFAIGCPAIMQSSEALKHVGPRYFGFDHDFVPIG